MEPVYLTSWNGETVMFQPRTETERAEILYLAEQTKYDGERAGIPNEAGFPGLDDGVCPG